MGLQAPVVVGAGAAGTRSDAVIWSVNRRKGPTSFDLASVREPMSMQVADDQMAAQFERIIRRVKSSMNYRGSYSTRDILGSLVARWLQSGEWERLKQLPPDQRHIGESVRRFILDRMEQLRRRGEQDEIPEDLLVVPDDETLIDMIETAELRAWIEARIADLEQGIVDERVRIPVTNPQQIGRALRLHINGYTQRQIATQLGLSLGAANKRIFEGTNYLIVLQGIELGIGVS